MFNIKKEIIIFIFDFAMVLAIELEKRRYNVIMSRYDGEMPMVDAIQSLKFYND